MSAMGEDTCGQHGGVRKMVFFQTSIMDNPQLYISCMNNNCISSFRKLKRCYMFWKILQCTSNFQYTSRMSECNTSSEQYPQRVLFKDCNRFNQNVSLANSTCIHAINPHWQFSSVSASTDTTGILIT